MLRERRCQLCEQRVDRGFLADDVGEFLWTQSIECGGVEPPFIERLQIFEPALRGRRFGPRRFAQRFHLEFAHVLGVTQNHLFVDAPFDFVFDRAMRDDVGQRVLDLCDGFLALRERRHAFERWIFEDEPL